MAELLGEVADSVGRVSVGGWCGVAAESASVRLGELAPVLVGGRDSFSEVSAALDEWSFELASGQKMVGEAIGLFADGVASTRRWVGAAPDGEVRVWGASGDPGGWYRSEAEALVRRARRVVDEAAERCSSKLEAAADAGYRHVGLWGGFAHHGKEVLGGVGAGIESLLEVPPALFEVGAWLLDTTPSNLDGRAEAVASFVAGVRRDPRRFLEQVIDWDGLIENPDRWAGRVIPETLAGLAGGSAVRASGALDEATVLGTILHFDERGILILGDGRRRTIVSSIAADSRLIREAEKAGRSMQRDLDAMLLKLGRGQTQQGIGSKPILADIYELRSKSGARIYFRYRDDILDIVAKSTKENQSRAIRILRELYG